LFPYILFEKYIHILALEIASPGNRHCANCIGTLSFFIATATVAIDRIVAATQIDQSHSQSCARQTNKQTTLLRLQQ